MKLLENIRYWKLTQDLTSVEPGYPLLIRERWRGVPNNIDSVITWKSGRKYELLDLKEEAKLK